MTRHAPHPFVREIAAQAKEGKVSRPDFFKYAAAFGHSGQDAEALMQRPDAESVPTGADRAENWEGLRRESPFEIKNLLIQRAEQACRANPGLSLLNAGRGNPDFLNTTVRKALALLMLFAALEAERDSPGRHLGRRVSKQGLAEKLMFFARDSRGEPGGRFLAEAVDFLLNELCGQNPDQAAFELVDAVQGDFYPDPPRILPVVETVVRAYLDRIVFSGEPPKGAYRLFATEGATAAMIYAFNSLSENRILNPGDKVAVAVPVFSPYLELPGLRDYGLESVYLNAVEDMGWQIPDEEIAKLRDPAVKALYLVNPTNPTSVSLDPDAVRRISAAIQEHNPNMVVISDTVYASFVDTFSTLGALIPENILGVYSFSKYFGVTGWRLGVIMVHEDNAMDRIITSLPQKDQALLDMRYRTVSTAPSHIPFHERLEIDSRQVALAHTGGLSGPQQAAMCLFSLFELLDNSRAYKKSVMGILKKRWSALFNALGIPEPSGDNLTRYYALIDLKRLAEARRGKEFAEELARGEPLEFVFRLADQEATVCLPGQGFAGPEWSLRVALSNLGEEECAAVGRNIARVLDSC